MYQSYSVAKCVINAVTPTVTVVILLRSIAEEQVRNNGFDLAAVQLSLNKENLHVVASAEVQVLYMSAEEVLHELFIDLMKQDCPFRQNLALIVVDQSHMVLYLVRINLTCNNTVFIIYNIALALCLSPWLDVII